MEKQEIGYQYGYDRSIDVTPEFINYFESYLKRRGHKESTIRAYISSLMHFMYWFERRYLCEKKINIKAIQIFLQEHLPICCCPGPVRKDIKTVRAALNQILLMNGDERIRMIIDETSPEIEAALDHFNVYLRNVCGYSQATRWYHIRHARMFISWLFGDGPIALSKITPESLCDFVITRASDYSPGSIGVLVYSLRTYLKFLQFNGHDTPSLASKIPKPPNWSAANLPQALNSMELKKFWSIFNRSTAIGKRDYAMARCLTDLGLRCCEVASIQLNAIDWHNGVLHLTQTKSRREDILPIPDITGRALVSYLRYGRPKTHSRAVFVHHRAPVGKAVKNTTVRGAVRRAFSRAGFPWTGTHILRSTVASRLLEGGASLKEIADVLRHRSINTTRSYTKIDLSNLAHVALPWPGRLS